MVHCYYNISCFVWHNNFFKIKLVILNNMDCLTVSPPSTSLLTIFLANISFPVLIVLDSLTLTEDKYTKMDL